jgi:hypothetical protein
MTTARSPPVCASVADVEPARLADDDTAAVGADAVGADDGIRATDVARYAAC